MMRWLKRYPILLFIAFAPAYIAVIYIGGKTPLIEAAVLGVFASLIPGFIFLSVLGSNGR